MAKRKKVKSVTPAAKRAELKKGVEIQTEKVTDESVKSKKHPFTFTYDNAYRKGSVVIQRIGGSDMWNVGIDGEPMGRVLGAQTKESAFQKAEKLKYANGGVNRFEPTNQVVWDNATNVELIGNGELTGSKNYEVLYNGRLYSVEVMPQNWGDDVINPSYSAEEFNRQGGAVGGINQGRFYEGQSIIIKKITTPSLIKALPQWNNYADKELVIEEIEYDTPHKKVTKAFVRKTGEKVPFNIYLNGSVSQYANGGAVGSKYDGMTAMQILRHEKSNLAEENLILKQLLKNGFFYVNYGSTDCDGCSSENHRKFTSLDEFQKWRDNYDVEGSFYASVVSEGEPLNEDVSGGYWGMAKGGSLNKKIMFGWF